MKIELLYFSNCPHWKPALLSLKQILTKENISESVDLIEIESEVMAEEHSFPGSPTIRINGRDIEGKQDVFGFQCRFYEGGEGTPSETLIKNAILKYK
ncbi:MAG: hypothetical protein HOK41_15750 [Nitrospina sp.]|nr:hypothetical protein [Nitrospina sp.]MBT6717115.1 hypothetical protein [Nitrospina sp.]